MDFLLDPTIAYLILLAGIFLSFLAFAAPGTGLLEIGALFCYVLAGYAAYNLSINWWALALLVLSVIPFVMAVRSSGQSMYLGISIVLLVVGSVFLFSSEERLISVNPMVALTASGLVSVSLWVMIRKSVEAMTRKPTHDPDALVGQVGEARSMIFNDGSIYIGGEMWSARSEAEIPSGSHVRVVRREGFVLVVENTNHSKS